MPLAITELEDAEVDVAIGAGFDGNVELGEILGPSPNGSALPAALHDPASALWCMRCQPARRRRSFERRSASCIAASPAAR